MNKKILGKNYKFHIKEINEFRNPINFEMVHTEKPLNYKGLSFTITDALSFEEFDKTLFYLTVNSNKTFGASFFIIDNEYVILNRSLDFNEILSKRFIDYKSPISVWFHAYIKNKIKDIKYYVILKNGTPLAFNIELDRKTYSKYEAQQDFLNNNSDKVKKEGLVEPNFEIINNIELDNKQPELLKFLGSLITTKKLSLIKPVREINDTMVDEFIELYNAGNVNYPVEWRTSKNDPIFWEEYSHDEELLEDLDSDNDFESSFNYHEDEEHFKARNKQDLNIETKESKEETFKKFNKDTKEENDDNFSVDPMDYVNKNPEEFINAMLEKMVYDLYNAARSMGVEDENMVEYFEDAFGEFNNLNLPNFPQQEEVKAKVRKILDKLMSKDSKTTIKSQKDNSENDKKVEEDSKTEDFGEEIN